MELSTGRLLAAAAICAGLAIAGFAPSRAHAVVPGANGQIAFTSTRDGDNNEVFAMNADGSGQTNLTNNAASDSNPAWSPDGTKIAFESTRDGNTEVYVMNADGSGQTNLTNNATDDGQPAWSPDGTKIAFWSNRDLNFNNEIYVMNADGSGQTNLTNNAGSDEAPAWSPDGTKITFRSHRTPNFSHDIFVMNADGSGQTNLTNDNPDDRDPAWSPDGTKIAFWSNRPPGPNDVWVMNANGSGVTNLSNNTAGNTLPAWSPDGTKIAFMSGRDGNLEVFSMNADGSSPTNLTNNAAVDHQPDWAAIDDADGDALPDSWEDDGVDVDGDGNIDLDLPAMGAFPDHKDIFIEIDHMPGHRIDDAQIDAVTAAFAAAPVSNPDGTGGIALHVDNGPGSTMDAVGSTWGSLSDQDTISHQNVLGTDFGPPANPTYDWTQFEAIRQSELLAIRRPVFHYVIAAHSGPSQRFSGISRGVIGGAADFIMAMHEVCDPAPQPLATECTPDPDRTSAVFMHELGHNLGLQHGGTDEELRKPNYLSVMNYYFGFGLIRANGGNELDYSRFNLPLNENALDEEIGFGLSGGPAVYKTIFACPNRTTRYTIPFTTQHTDWNCDRSITGIGTISSDVSGNGTTGQLAGPIDWNRIVFSGGGIGALSAAPGPGSTPITEPTPTELQANRNLLEHGGPPPVDPTAKSKPRNDFTIGKAKRNKRNGTAKLTVSVPGPGSVELAQDKKVKGDRAEADAAGELELLVKAKGKARKKLSKAGKAKIAAEVTYTPAGGEPNTQTASVKLVRK